MANQEKEKDKQNELVVRKAFAVAPIGDQEGVAEEMDGLQFRFNTVKIPSGGQLAFEMVGETDEDTEYVKELKGVLVYHHPINVYWDAAYTGGNTPPDCASFDGKEGTGHPGGPCAACPMNQWGTGKVGKDGEKHGKACANRRRVYLLCEGDMFPLLISLPPTSLANFSDFISRRVIQKNKRSYEFVCRMTLKKTTSTDGVEYSQVFFSFVEDVDDASKIALKKYAADIKAIANTPQFNQLVGGEIADGDIEEDGSVKPPFDL